ncbi:MAG: hypothetical protein P9M14_16060 [Candidatus Alcyoniella australis]|nr:hypothetical protein [Candidatus Alcyoniella australis]
MLLILRRVAYILAAAVLAAWALGVLLRAHGAWHRGLELVLLSSAQLVLLRIWPLIVALLGLAALLGLGSLAYRPLRRAAWLLLRIGLYCLALVALIVVVLSALFGLSMDRPAFLTALIAALIGLSARRLFFTKRPRAARILGTCCALVAAATLAAVGLGLGRGIALGWSAGPPATLALMLKLHLTPLLAPAALGLGLAWGARNALGQRPRKRLASLCGLLLLCGTAGLVSWCGLTLSTAVHVRDAGAEPWPGVRRLSDRPDGFWIEAVDQGVLATYNRTGVIARLDPDLGEVQRAQIPGSHLQQFVRDPKRGVLFVANHTAPELQVVLIDELTLRPQGGLSTGCPKTSELAIDEQYGRLFASCENRPALAVFDLESLELQRSIALSQREGQYAVSVGPGDAPYLWTLDAFDGWLHRLDRAGLSPAGRALAGFVAFAALTDAQRDLVWVALPLRSQVLGFDAQTLKQRVALNVGFGARFLALHPRLPVLFVSEYFSGTLRAVDLESGRTLYAIRLGPLLRGLSISPEGDALYALSLFGTFRVDLANGVGAL